MGGSMGIFLMSLWAISFCDVEMHFCCLLQCEMLDNGGNIDATRVLKNNTYNE